MDLSALIPVSAQSATAVPGAKSGKSDVIYSSVVLAHSGSGPVRAFTQAKGAGIPVLTGLATAPVQVHQQKYDDHTTNLSQAGMLGDGVGDAAVRAIGIDIENAVYTTAGAPSTYGATQKEVADILAKCAFTFKITNNEVTKGALLYFPALGGETGAISTTGNNTTTAIVSNGVPGMGNFYDFPIMVAQSNTVEAVIATGNGSTLAFTSTTSDGQPCLLRIGLRSWLLRDVQPS